MTEPLNYEGPLPAEVVARVEDFLKTPIECDDDSWPIIPKDVWHELHDVFYLIIEAKFQRDCDNDQGVELALCDRKKNRMEALYIPYDCVSDADIEKAAFSAEIAASVSEQIMKRIGFTLSTRARANVRKDKFKDVLGFLAPNGHIQAWQRIKDMLDGEERGLYIGSKDDVWAPLGLTAKEIHDCARDFKGKQDRVDTLLIEAVQKIKGNI